MLRDGGAALLVATARYWAGRAAFDADGTAHVRGVIGPDEYHGPIDDNAFTNVMARHNLRLAAAVPSSVADIGAAERATWLDLADRLVDGWDPETGIYEQFAGFDALEPILIADIAEPPVAADLLVGRDRIGATQVIKQADVLMLHHLVPEEVHDESLATNLDHYLPRTAHGSSLSPAIGASLLARAGRPDEALGLLDVAARLDLENLNGTSGEGIHLATLGGLWQAIAFGFAGIRPRSDALAIDPHLPTAWLQVSIRLRYRSARLRVEVRSAEIVVSSSKPVTLEVGHLRHDMTEPSAVFALTDGMWTWTGSRG